MPSVSIWLGQKIWELLVTYIKNNSFHNESTCISQIDNITYILLSRVCLPSSRSKDHAKITWLTVLCVLYNKTGAEYKHGCSNGYEHLHWTSWISGQRSTVSYFCGTIKGLNVGNHPLPRNKPNENMPHANKYNKI